MAKTPFLSLRLLTLVCYLCFACLLLPVWSSTVETRALLKFKSQLKDRFGVLGSGFVERSYLKILKQAEVAEVPAGHAVNVSFIWWQIHGSNVVFKFHEIVACLLCSL
ncbi:hypothetical protein QYF36_000864 [Acer negundo]|nr:hypothetical protein QYF36_000864 [Acer negundo]